MTQDEQNWKDIAKRLYGVVLHLTEISKGSIAIIGPSLYKESVLAIDEYEKLIIKK